MTPTGEEELYVALIVWGGIIFAGSLIGIWLTIVGLSLLRKKNKITNLYEQKDRQNGQHKSGARGKW